MLPNREKDRQAILQTALDTVGQKPVYFDTETTGTGPYDEVVEIGIVDYDGQVLLQALVKPRGSIPPDAARIHGISNDMVRDALTWAELWPDVEKAFAGRLVAAYNTDFDVRLLRQSHARSQMQWRDPWKSTIDVMQVYAQYHGEWNNRRGNYRWWKLEQAGRFCNIPLPNSHRAVDDALLTRALLEHIAAQAKPDEGEQLSMF